MDIIFLGGLFPKDKEDEIINNSIVSIQNAANNLQWEFVNGLDMNLSKPIKIVNSLYIGSFPKRYKKMFIKTYNFNHSNHISHDVNVGFINLPLIKNYSRYKSLISHFNKWSLEDSTSIKVVIAYAMTITFTHLLRYVKKLNRNIITCLIVPDLPQYMNNSYKMQPIYTFAKNIEIALIKHDLKYIDSYVLLTEYMKELLNISVPYVVIEGISTRLFDDIKMSNQKNNIKTILYTGGLNEKYGVIKLVKAFEKLENQDCQLILCGSGDAENYIIKAANRDSRIIYKGLIKREDVLALQKSATVLVNPRPNNEEYTKYSFPSKNLEYMSSGTPVISYKLDGMPSDYDEHLYLIMDDLVDDEALYNKLKEVVELPDELLREKGLRARKFVMEEKNCVYQTKKILDMITKIADSKEKIFSIDTLTQ